MAKKKTKDLGEVGIMIALIAITINLCGIAISLLDLSAVIRWISATIMLILAGYLFYFILKIKNNLMKN